MRVSSSSPAACPSVSLTCLNPSRSSSRSAPGRPWRRARLTSRSSSSWKRRRLKSPVSASRSAISWSWFSRRLRSLMSTACMTISRSPSGPCVRLGAVSAQMSCPSLCLKRSSPAAGRPASTLSSIRRRMERSSGCTIAGPTVPSSSDGSRPSMAAKAGLHWMTSTLPSSWTRLTTMPTGAEENAVSNSERAAASSRATRSRSVTSSDTPPIPTIRSSASRTGNFSDQTWRALPVRASGTVSSKLMSSPLLSTWRSWAARWAEISGGTVSESRLPSNCSGDLPRMPQVSGLATIQRSSVSRM